MKKYLLAGLLLAGCQTPKTTKKLVLNDEQQKKLVHVISTIIDTTKKQ